MAQKRKRDFSNVPTFNLFSAFSTDGKIKSQGTFQVTESDEEEDLEDLRAKLQGDKKGKGKKKMKGGSKTRGRHRFSDSSEDDDDAVLVGSSPGEDHIDLIRQSDSPSPPPPPEFDDQIVREIMQKNKRSARVIQNMETTMRTYQMSKAMAERESGISPILSSPTKVCDVATPVARETITVKVRSRQGMLRFPGYSMDDTFENIFSQLGQQEGVDKGRVRITRKGEDINQTDTPRAVQLHVADILDFVIVDGTAPTLNYSLLDEDDFVIIKLRTSERNSETSRRIPKMEKMERIFAEYSESIGKPVQRLRFFFDGDPVSPENTPEEMDMDEENVIDVEIV